MAGSNSNGKSGKSETSTVATAAVGETTPAAEDSDYFSDTPTESNRANPLPAPAAEDTSPTPPPEVLSSPGSYRLVRPATSDHIPTPAPVVSKADKSPSSRVIIGVARKTQ